MIPNSSYQGFAVSSAENRDSSRRRSAAANTFERSVARTSNHHLIHCEGQHVSPRTTNHGFKLAGEQPNVLVEALQRTRYRDPQEIAVGENAGRRGRE